MLFDGWQEGHLNCKKTRFWYSDRSLVHVRFPIGTTAVSAISHCSKCRVVLQSGTSLPRLSWDRGRQTRVC